ncbi:MAG: hypothetical protein WKF79_09760 [Nocardioides sp.]
MSLDQIGVRLDAGAEDRHRVLEAHLADLDRRMAEMATSKAMTDTPRSAGPTMSPPAPTSGPTSTTSCREMDAFPLAGYPRVVTE